MYILDTGPILKFLTTDCVPELLSALGNHPIHVPEAVQYEVLDTPTRHPQFARAAELWPRIPDRFKVVLPDTPTDELRKLCRSVLKTDFDSMYRQTRDRGENMAILHAVSLAREGNKVYVACDEESETGIIKREANALKMQQMFGHHVPGGSIEHIDTRKLLKWAIENGAFESRELFLAKYDRMAKLDASMPETAKEAGLTGSPPWPN